MDIKVDPKKIFEIIGRLYVENQTLHEMANDMAINDDQLKKELAKIKGENIAPNP
jgi:hypothetical protein